MVFEKVRAISHTRDTHLFPILRATSVIDSSQTIADTAFGNCRGNSEADKLFSIFNQWDFANRRLIFQIATHSSSSSHP